jgi:hypothetical protein
VVRSIVKILSYTILDHSCYLFCIILHDRIFWRCPLHLHFLAHTSILGIGTWCGPLHSLSPFLLFLGQICVILLPLLGPYISCPFVCLLYFFLARPSFLGHLDFLRLCFSLPLLLFFYFFQQVLDEDWNLTLIFPIFDSPCQCLPP